MKINEALLNKLNDNIATEENHSMDNGFIYLDLEDTELSMIRNKYEPFGICAAPYNSHGKFDIAFVYEDCDFEKHWCHLTKNIYNDWLKQL